jgi:hypothetical protein
MHKSYPRLSTSFHQFGTKQTYRNLINVFPQVFITSRPNRLTEILSTFFHNFSSARDQTDLQKSYQRFSIIFHQLGTKETSRNLINIFPQFSITSRPNRLPEISSTFFHNFSSIRDKTELQRSDQLFTEFSLIWSELFDTIFVQFVWPADSIRPFYRRRG